MNYRVIRLLSVGAWALVYFHVLRSLLCCNGVMGDAIKSKTKIKTIQQQYFDDLKSENNNNNIIDDTVIGWLTGDYNLKARNLLNRNWKDENQFMLDTFYHRTLPPQYFTDEEQVVGEYAELLTLNNVGSDSLCLEESHEREAVREPFIESGCRYLESDDVLICDDTGLMNVPQFPDNVTYLKIFELNLTTVRVLPRQAFGEIEIENIKIEANVLLTCIDPYAFEGVTGVKTLTMSHNNISMVRLGDFKTFLNETYFMYLEHNKINLHGYDDDIWNYTTPRSTGYDGFDPDNNNIHNNGTDVESEPVLPSLIVLSLLGNPLERIPARYFYPIRQSPLTTLSLSCCQLIDIHRDTFSHLPKLADLDLSENPKLMSKLGQAFAGVNAMAMKTLRLANNYMVQVPSEELDHLSHLETLDLHGNLFDTLRKECFGSDVYKTLLSLNLNNCRIRSIQEGAFQEFLKLETLTLNNNRLATIPPSISYLSNLKTFELSANVPADTTTFSAMSVEHGNKLTFQIYPPVFSNLTKLEYLSLDNLPLSRIEKSTFKGLTNLRYLSVSDTSQVKEDEHLDFIADHAFQDMTNLKILRLENNELTEITQLTFSGLDNVDNLFLNKNNIDLQDLTDSIVSPTKFTDSQPSSGVPYIGGIKDEPFKNLPKLKWLHMANNKVRYIDSSLFKGLPNLVEVDLRDNSIHSWGQRVFENNLALEKLFLGHNNIGPITTAMLEDFLDLHFGEPVTGLDHNLDISNNPLVCGENICEIAKRANERSLLLENWFDSGYHTCLDTNTNMYHHMKNLNLSSSICTGKTGIGGDDSTALTPSPTTTTESLGSKGGAPDPETSTSSFGTTFAIIFLCTCFVSAVGVIGYKKRFHLKYFWFVVKFNVVNLPDLNIVSKRRGSIPSYEYDIFVSYNHTDRGFIEDYLVVQIEDFPNNTTNSSGSDDGSATNDDNYDVESCKSGTSGSSGDSNSSSKLKVCIHERDFKAGVPITDNIVDFVDRSRKVVVVVSKNYLESQWCLYEMNLAYHRLIESGRRSFLVILLEDIPATLRTKSLNYLLLSRTYLEWPGSSASVADQNLFWKRLRNSLCNPSH